MWYGNPRALASPGSRGVTVPACTQGYLFIAVLLHEEHELVRLLIQSIRNDLVCRNEVCPPQPVACLRCRRAVSDALAGCTGVCVPGPDVRGQHRGPRDGRDPGRRHPAPAGFSVCRCPPPAHEVHRSLIRRIRDSNSFVKKKSALALLRLYRKYPDVIPMGEWRHSVLNLLDEKDLVCAETRFSIRLGACCKPEF